LVGILCPLSRTWVSLNSKRNTKEEAERFLLSSYSGPPTPPPSQQGQASCNCDTEVNKETENTCSELSVVIDVQKSRGLTKLVQ